MSERMTATEIRMMAEQAAPMLTKLSYDWSREINKMLGAILLRLIIRLSWVKYNPQLLLTYTPKD